MTKDRVIKRRFMTKDRVIKGCFMTKDRVMKGRFMTKDRVMKRRFMTKDRVIMGYCNRFPKQTVRDRGERHSLMYKFPIMNAHAQSG